MIQTLYKPKALPDRAHIRVISPSCSAGSINPDTLYKAVREFERRGYRLSFGKNTFNIAYLDTASIKDRVEDLHEAFRDPEVDAVLCARGGFLSNQLLEYIDWELVKAHPKILCGYSDITSLHTAFLSQANLVTFHGPVFSSFGKTHDTGYTWDSFLNATQAPAEGFSILEPRTVLDPAEVNGLFVSEGWKVLAPGYARGMAIGGNQCTFNLLQGTQFFPDFGNEPLVLFLEDDYETHAVSFARDFQSTFHALRNTNIVGLVIGRLQKVTGVDMNLLKALIADTPKLAGVPIVCDVDFSHTDPRFTFPVGGECELVASESGVRLCFK